MTTTGSSSGRRIGEIAAATAMTVRTLHYYEEIGLIAPDRTDAGHRLYGPAAVERLYKISLLRQLGLPLDAIRATLDSERSGDAGRADLRSLMVEHLRAVDERLTAENRLRGRLVKLVGTLDAPPNPPSTAATSTQPTADTTGDLLSILEDMTMLETTLERRIAILVYDDIAAAYDYLTTVYGFGPGELMRDPDGNVVHAEIQAGDGEFWLHTESQDFGLRTPNHLGGSSGTMAVMVDDVDAHFRFAVEHGATIRYEPTDQPYGYREYSAIDLDGHLWSFMKPLDD